MEAITEDIEEVVQGESFEEKEREHNLFIFKLKNNKYILYFVIINSENDEIVYSIMKEFDDLELAKKDFENYRIKEEEEKKE